MLKNFSYFFSCISLLISQTVSANLITANSGNYTTYLNSLNPGDTLYLTAGTYLSDLTLNGQNGDSSHPIVIMGSAILYTTIFQAQSCCNTVSITQCSYLIIKNLQLDGMNIAVDAVKAEGTAGNWAHHITLEYLNIIHYGSDQQNVGISTKCSAWNWVIRKNRIIGAGTGMYLGNSDGSDPFVNGTIEYNFIAGTIGYNMEIKQQTDTVRDNFAGTSVNGKTMIRYNVFTKDSTSSTGADARPNLLVGGFPLNGWGSLDYYEIYGNFFYQNPVEALFQGTGNIMLYENIFVNHFDPAGLRAVYFTDQNGVQPQDIKVFHNTVWANNSSGGIRIYNPDINYQQYCYSNAVFAPAPITNFTNSVDNITDAYLNAFYNVLSATTNISTLNLYPQSGQLTGTLTSSALFQNNTNWDKDFNGDVYDWTFRGAYSGCCVNIGWQLQLDTMPTLPEVLNAVPLADIGQQDVIVYPNPFSTTLNVHLNTLKQFEIKISDLTGEEVLKSKINTSLFEADFINKPSGIYFLQIKTEHNLVTKKIIKQ
ncbi:MAG TPA: T9SS type A sorting domain-containing protein [Chitinophagales bacterium]|nr:T9SS type A sorting domain-containing protein [Chitinophagales bacterium]